METAEETKLTSAPKKGLDKAAIENATKILKAVTPGKLMKSFNRNVNDNIKLNKFLSNEVEIPKAFRPQEIESIIVKLLEPTKHEFHGLGRVKQQRLILSLLESNILAIEIAEKTAWGQSFKLDEEMEKNFAKALARYEQMLKSAIIQGVSKWRKVYGEEPEEKVENEENNAE